MPQLATHEPRRLLGLVPFGHELLRLRQRGLQLRSRLGELRTSTIDLRSRQREIAFERFDPRADRGLASAVELATGGLLLSFGRRRPPFDRNEVLLEIRDQLLGQGEPWIELLVLRHVPPPPSRRPAAPGAVRRPRRARTQSLLLPARP